MESSQELLEGCLEMGYKGPIGMKRDRLVLSSKRATPRYTTNVGVGVIRAVQDSGFRV